MIKQQGIISSCGHMTLKVKTRSRSTLPFVQLQPDVTDMTWRVFKMSKTKYIGTQTFNQMSQSQVLQMLQFLTTMTAPASTFCSVFCTYLILVVYTHNSRKFWYFDLTFGSSPVWTGTKHCAAQRGKVFAKFTSHRQTAATESQTDNLGVCRACARARLSSSSLGRGRAGAARVTLHTKVPCHFLCELV